MKPYFNTTQVYTTLINSKTTPEWEVSDYIALRGETLYAHDNIAGKTVYSDKIGDGIHTWDELPYHISPLLSNYRPVQSLTYADFEPLSDGTLYVNEDWADTEYKIFNQSANRFLNVTEIAYDPTGGFTLIGGFRIYEGQEFIAIF